MSDIEEVIEILGVTAKRMVPEPHRQHFGDPVDPRREQTDIIAALKKAGLISEEQAFIPSLCSALRVVYSSLGTVTYSMEYSVNDRLHVISWIRDLAGQGAIAEFECTQLLQ